MSKVLYIIGHQVLPYIGGASKASVNLFQIINKTADQVEVICPIESVDHYKNLGISVYGIKRRNFFSKVVETLLCISRDRFSNCWSRSNFDILSFSHIFLDGALLGRMSKTLKEINPSLKIIQFHHNDEILYYKDEFVPFPLSLLNKKIILNNQGIGWRMCDVNLTFTKNDLDRLNERYGEHTGEVFGYFESVDSHISHFGPRQNRKKTLIITGNLSMQKGYVGVIDFIRDYWPSVDKDRYQLVIAGKNPTSSLSNEIAKHPQVQLIPNPKCMKKIIDQCDIYLNPNTLGSGIKVRNFDGLRLGLPTLCHTGNEYGFEELPKNCFYVYHSVDSFLKGLSELNFNKSYNFNLYQSLYSLEAGFIKLNQIIQK